MSAEGGPLGIVDVQAHIVPGELLVGADALDPSLAELRDVAGRQRLFTKGRELTSIVGEFVDPVRMAAEAAAAGIDHLLLSPWVQLLPAGLPPAVARRRCEVLHAALAGVVASDPARFSAVGAVPIDYPSEAVATLRAARSAGLAGVEVPASAGNYLGDEALEPCWAAAEELGAVVLVHPATRGIALPALDDFYLWNTVGNPVETAVAGAHLALTGALERHPDLRVLLAHGGGALPGIRGRLRHGHSAVPSARGRLSGPIDDSLARFYFDTVTHDVLQLRRLVDDFGADRVLLGSDRPFDMGDPHPVGTVRSLGLSPAGETAVLGANAARLLGRVRPAAPG
jgi:aminocarboxymuconate-semialdehyde decarboxylase